MKKEVCLADWEFQNSVNWAGGGDIRDDAIKEWTLTTLKQVAMSFPDAVAACKFLPLTASIDHDSV